MRLIRKASADGYKRLRIDSDGKVLYEEDFKFVGANGEYVMVSDDGVHTMTLYMEVGYDIYDEYGNYDVYYRDPEYAWKYSESNRFIDGGSGYSTLRGAAEDAARYMIENGITQREASRKKVSSELPPLEEWNVRAANDWVGYWVLFHNVDDYQLEIEITDDGKKILGYIYIWDLPSLVVGDEDAIFKALLYTYTLSVDDVMDACRDALGAALNSIETGWHPDYYCKEI